MEQEFENINFYEVETSSGQSASVNKIHGEAGPKPVFYLYKDGEKVDSLGHSWPVNEAELW